VRTRRTDSRMFGRSKSPITCAGSRRPSRLMISSRTGGAAVAVNASLTGAPTASACAPSSM